jgi:hypothetical protein
MYLANVEAQYLTGSRSEKELWQMFEFSGDNE